MSPIVDQLIGELIRLQTIESEHFKAICLVDRVFQRNDPDNPPILEDFLRCGEDKFRGVVRLAQEYKDLLAASKRWKTRDSDGAD